MSIVISKIISKIEAYALFLQNPNLENVNYFEFRIKPHLLQIIFVQVKYA